MKPNRLKKEDRYDMFINHNLSNNKKLGATDNPKKFYS